MYRKFLVWLLSGMLLVAAIGCGRPQAAGGSHPLGSVNRAGYQQACVPTPGPAAPGGGARTMAQLPQLPDARELASATLLCDGRVLLVGGVGLGLVQSNGNRYAQSSRLADLYNPSLGTWSSAAAMTHRRWGQTATRLADGRVLVAGGVNSQIGATDVYQASAEIYDPATNRWSPTGAMSTGRDEAAAVLLTDGTVLVVGGLGPAQSPSGLHLPLATAEIYDPATGKWQGTGSLHVARASTGDVGDGRLNAVLLPDGRVLVDGGYDTSGKPSETPKVSELYDPSSRRWTELRHAALPVNLWTTVLPNHTVLGLGGEHREQAFIFDTAKNAWRPIPTHGSVNFRATLVTLADGRVLACGGLDPSNQLSNSAAVFNPATGSWAPTGAMVLARERHVAVLLANGEVLVTKGGSHNGADLTSEVYNPKTGTWSPTGS